MKDAKNIILLIGCLLNYAISFGQELKIDSLRNLLPGLKDTSRIDCLNEIAFYYITIQDRDTFEYYSTLAYNESKNLNYIHGIALTLAQKASYQKHYGNDRKAQTLARESLRWYQLTNNKKYIAIPYYQMGREFFAQSRWAEALINLRQCLYWQKKSGDINRLLGTISLIGEVYRESSEYDSAFYVFMQELRMAEQFKDTLRIEGALCNIGDVYQAIEDYSTALLYYNQAFKVAKPQDLTVFDYTGHAELFSFTHQYDSALHYYNCIDSAKTDIENLPFFLVSKGEYFLLRKEYETALGYFLKGLLYHRQLNSVNQIKRALLDIAKAYAGENNNVAALKYAHEGLNISLQTKSRQYIRDAYLILYSVYNEMHNTDSAFEYYKHYITMKDILQSDQLKGKFAAYNYEQTIALLDKEKQLQQQQLQQSAQQRIFLIIGLTCILLLAIIILRNTFLKRKNDKNLREIAENELQLERVVSEKKLSELEMQALRAQMNPHFIFNSLNSINRFILQNNKDQASEYLTKFSKLVRLILQNSSAALITLESELEALQLYLELESLRFNHRFNFKISVDDELDPEVIKVPPLIIQPYAENAIWHGLMQKSDIGKLEIEISEQLDLLKIKISDDGIGRKKAAELKSKSATTHKSMGLKITKDRIMMMDKTENREAVVINDVVHPDGSAAGTEVIIKIPITYDKSNSY